MVFHFPFSSRRVAAMSYNVYFIAGDYSRQAAKAPPPRAPAAVVSTSRPKSEVRPALPITDGTARFDPPRRPPGPMSVVLQVYRKSVDHQPHREVWHLYSLHHWDPDLLDPVDLVKRDLDPIAVHDLGP